VRYLFGLLALLPVAYLVVGTVRGKRPIDPCCSDPASDGRVSAAIAELDDAPARPPRR
jgi:hypothetical protein